MRARVLLSVAAGLLLVGAIGVAARRDRTPDPRPLPSPAPMPSATFRPSELYASDNTTLIARFDSADPRAACPKSAYPFFCDYFVTWWSEQKSLAELGNTGFRITGSLDVALQEVAQEGADAVLPDGSVKAFAVASVEPSSGLVRTMATDREFGTASASPSPLQWQGSVPGPMSVPLASEGGSVFLGGATFGLFTLVAALEKGLPLSHPIATKARYTSKYLTGAGTPGACEGNHWCPRNVGDSAYRSGTRTMWDGFGHSVATYLVPLEEQVGAENVVEVARRLGIRLHGVDEQMGDTELAAGWGAFTLGVSQTSPLDLASAYATLAADGLQCGPVPAVQVNAPNGMAITVGSPCAQVVTPEVARAAMDAARCGVGDRSAFGDRCGSGKAPAASVRGLVGRPVSGQLGVGDGRSSAALVVAGPQLVTAGIAGGGAKSLPAGAEGQVVTAVGQVERSGLAPLPSQDFTAPPRKLALG